MGTIAMAQELQPGCKKGHEHIVSDRVGKRQAALAALQELEKLREDLPPADAVQIVREGRDSANRNASQ